MPIDFATMMQQMDDPAFLERLAYTPLDPNVLLQLDAAGQGLQPLNPNAVPGGGLQPPGVNPAQPGVGQAQLQVDENPTAPKPGVDLGAMLAAMGPAAQMMTPPPQAPLPQPEQLALGPAQPAQVQRFATGPTNSRPQLSLAEILTQFKGG